MDRYLFASVLRTNRLVRFAVWTVALVASAGFAMSASTSLGQGAGLGPSLGFEPTGVNYPPPQYYMALQVYHTGELDRAIDAFDVAIGRTRRDINGHWIDAIPVYAMMAECQYRLGDLEGAMQSLDTALNIAVRYRGWLRRPVWEELLRGNVQVSPKQYLWPAAKSVNRLPLTRSLKYYSGEVLTEQRLAAGGRIEELNIKTVDTVEILRGLAMASYRRRIILGPLSENDALAAQVVESTKYPSNAPPLARGLIGAMRAAEKFGVSDDVNAIKDAGANLLLNNGVHPLSPIAGLSAASALAGTETPVQAVPLCLAAANQAAALEQFGWIGEAYQLAAGCAGPTEATAVQQAAAEAARSLIRESRLASLHCLIAAADAAVTAGDLNFATARLGEARELSQRRDVTQPRLEAYGAYVAARLASRSGGSAFSGSVRPWDEPLNNVMGFATASRIRNRNLISMPQLYQLQRIRQALGRNLNGQSADVMLARYVDDPTEDVWRRDPVDALAGWIADRDALRIARLRNAASRDSAQDVLMRVEDLQRGRLRQRTALGGRVLQVRALARLPDALLEGSTVEFRNKAAKPIRDLRTAATAPPPADPSAALAAAGQMESDAWAIALDRVAIPQTMPRPMDEKQPTKDIPDGVGVLCFCQDGNVIHVTLCTRDKSSYWSISGANRVGTEIAKVMRGIGASKNRGARLPEDDSWRDDALELRDRLIMPGTGNLMDDRFVGLQHLVVIPDSLLWYLPFELLPTEDRNSKLLGDTIQISYAATPALALHPTALKSDSPVAAMSSGLFFAPRDQELNQGIVQSIVDAVDPGALVRLPDQAGVATSQTGPAAGSLLIAEPTVPNPDSTLDSALAGYEASLPGGSLRSWLSFPAAKPGTVFLSGFRSHLDTGRPVSGSEIFQTIGTLQYSGVRDVILSRWAVGGASTGIVLREFMQELPFIGPSDAFSRAKSVLRRSELSPMAEPTLTSADQERVTLSGDEPFFWSTYLLAAPVNDSN
ncbi:CHAT domain-containing protein [Roseiconus nitratireducens]|uniref:CHAT domain-containing protein n=1 Tax=Roseiconus nitratireducens TaxID=2605748 RepID=A0A5M6DCN1_9BACT|nr:CHAT domain-containing protein [Roseiconus nitratireducens]KAA5545317.1 CHAT domain-containing protein [Roseiconus nitratireducens]